ncbi:AraC family transcriptional regulator [Mycoplasmatota bacterium]|nr:AraC family transcriptional regulator [Mycoplasmatota bacterium]
MKVLHLLQDKSFQLVTGKDLDNEINGIYSGDLLSWVMSHAKAQDAWCTVLTHVNIVAIASLVQLSCIIICENAQIDVDTIEKAKQENIIIIKTKLNSVEVMKKLMTTHA